MRPSVAVHWFRRDLRLDDNEALTAAIDSGLPVLPVFCLPSEELESDWLGINRWGKHKLQFLLESLSNLDASLKTTGGKLIFFDASINKAIESLREHFNIELLTFHREWAWEEAKEEESLRKELSEFKVKIQAYHGQSLYHPEDVDAVMDQMPDVFGSFRKPLEKHCSIRPCLEQVTSVRMPDLPEKIQNEVPIEPKTEHEPRFRGGEAMGRERLDYYIWTSKKLGVYKKTRNGLLGDDYSSKFSPWLAWGSLSPRRIFHEVKRFEQEEVKNSSTYWLIFELIWRDFFRFHARKSNRSLFLWKGYKNVTTPADGKPHLFDFWIQGRTGYPFVDANMLELAETGFMSNRGRQNVASFLVHDLRLDWRLGAIWFERQLIDYDPYSNYGNWQYVAGNGTDPRPDRYFNVLSQAARYDPKAKYVRQWLPELKKLSDVEAQKPWLARKEAVNYPKRLVKLKVEV